MAGSREQKSVTELLLDHKRKDMGKTIVIQNSKGAKSIKNVNNDSKFEKQNLIKQNEKSTNGEIEMLLAEKKAMLQELQLWEDIKEKLVDIFVGQLKVNI